MVFNSNSFPIGADLKKQTESYQQPMYNNELQEVVQQNDGDFFSQRQEQTTIQT